MSARSAKTKDNLLLLAEGFCLVMLAGLLAQYIGQALEFLTNAFFALGRLIIKG